MIKKIFILWGFVLLTLFLGGCAKHPIEVFSPKDFVNPNRIVTKHDPVNLPPAKVHATFGLGNNSEVVQAYKQFSKEGLAKSIKGKGFVTLPYDAYSHPIVACEPLHLCIVQLERGETINNIDLGDSVHWLVSTGLIGTLSDGSTQIAIKPKDYHLATDMVITTNKRTYNIGLVSKAGESTHVVRFYYPNESLHDALNILHKQKGAFYTHSVIDTRTHVSLDHLHFSYQLHGDYPAWRPLQVFDDGNKTFIHMPEMTSHGDLPVLYLVRRSMMQLVNYRYQRPYYVVDALFKRAVLVSGRGHHQVKVVIDHV